MPATATRLLVLAAAMIAASPAPRAQPAPQDAPSAAKARTRNVAIVVHEGVELLDFAGPGEVFEAASMHGGGAAGSRSFNVYTVAPTAGDVVSQGFVTIKPQYTIETCPKPDILVIPGGATRKLTSDPAFMAWVQKNAGQRELTLTVCTGAFVLAHSKLLDGKPVTTHWGSIDALRRAAPSADVRESIRFVDNGNIVTTAGVSAGIDGALHVVGRLLGRMAAESTARYMEYEWRPDPQVLASYPKVNPELDAGNQARHEGEMLRNAGKWPEAIAAFEAIIAQHPKDADAWYQLGYCLHASGNLDRAIEVHEQAAALAERPHRPLYNLACAYALKGEPDQAFAALDRAIAAGFDNAAYASGDSDFASVRDDPRFAAALERMKAKPGKD